MTAIGFSLMTIGWVGLLIVGTVGTPFSFIVTRSEKFFAIIFWLGVVLLAAGVAKILWDIMP